MIITDRLKLSMRCRPTTVKECQELYIFTKLENELHNSEMQGHPGLGLAANQSDQVPFQIQACIIQSKDKEKYKPIRMINPKITLELLPIINHREGCLSFPGIKVNTQRYEQITATYIDFDLNEEVTEVFFGEVAICIEHEIDHLSGTTIFDRKISESKPKRNELCPECLKNGTSIKWKKCILHNK